MQKINLIFRGHVRDAFDNERLNSYVSEIRKSYEINIYINTWNEIECKRSWRSPSSLVKRKTIITKDIIQKYFKTNCDLIKKIQIQEENDNNLIGDVLGHKETNNGLSSNCWMPKKGWKFFVYNAYESFKLIPPEERNLLTLSIRLDMITTDRLVSIWHGFDKINIVKSFTAITKKYIASCDLNNKHSRICSIGGSGIGFDNAFIGDYYYLFNLFKLLHHHLDYVVADCDEFQKGGRQEIICRYLSTLLIKNDNVYKIHN